MGIFTNIGANFVAATGKAVERTNPDNFLSNIFAERPNAVEAQKEVYHNLGDFLDGLCSGKVFDDFAQAVGDTMQHAGANGVTDNLAFVNVKDCRAPDLGASVAV
jgi:hypothetical protein